MADKPVKLGLDRFLAKEWVDYSLELYLSSEDDDQNYLLLKDYLQTAIHGNQSARKTGNQLKRLWLRKIEPNDYLRKTAKEILMNHQVVETTIFNLGMALNVFPIFKETCRRIGELSQLQTEVNKQTIVDRVIESFVTPTSIPRIVARVFQTLINWELIEENQGKINIKNLEIKERQVSVWFIQALLSMDSRGEILLNDFSLLPEKMGVFIPDIRAHLQNAHYLSIRRSLTGEEIITVK